ncbi:MAG TPA: DUF1150 family protein [Devosiaceae bacterium]|nr:DUF1150 family protein [Devosiaceae bacterium]
MHDSYEYQPESSRSSSALHAWKEMTLAEFVVLGANALAYIRPISGHQLAILLADPQLDCDQTFQLIISADGSALLVTDTLEEAKEWLDETNLSMVTLH